MRMCTSGHKFGTYSQTGKNREHQEYFWNIIVFQEKKPIKHEKTELQARSSIVCGFVASSHVLIFAVIGHNTINIPEIFQVFMVLPCGHIVKG